MLRRLRRAGSASDLKARRINEKTIGCERDKYHDMRQYAKVEVLMYVTHKYQIFPDFPFSAPHRLGQNGLFIGILSPQAGYTMEHMHFTYS